MMHILNGLQVNPKVCCKSAYNWHYDDIRRAKSLEHNGQLSDGIKT
jgi:hypothetical protein